MPQHIPSVETTTPPPGGYASWDEYMADVEALEDCEHGTRQRGADYDANHLTSLRISKAMRLAPNASVFAALLKGQPVPHEAMDPEWLRRYA